MKRQITEAGALAVSEADATTGLFEIQIITPGQGSSGYYPAETLEAAAKDRVFAKGTHIYLDHPTATENRDRPERSVRDLAGALTEDARWDGNALVASARIYSSYRPLVTEAAEDLGMSIRAMADTSEATVGGTKVLQVDRITEAWSVDVVTRAGRGGKVLGLLESARASEATSDDLRDRLQRALPGHSWLRDFDPDASVAFYTTYDENTGADALWSQSYQTAEDGLSATLTGEPTEVRSVTTYVPVDKAAGLPNEEKKMPEIDKDRLAALEAAEGQLAAANERVAELEAAQAAHEQAEAARAALDAATGIVTKAVADLDPLIADKVKESMADYAPMTDDRALDTAAVEARVAQRVEAEKAYAAKIAEAAGRTPSFGLGPSTPVDESASTTKPHGSPWGRTSSKKEG